MLTVTARVMIYGEETRVTAVREMELPFVPFPGLALDFGDCRPFVSGVTVHTEDGSISVYLESCNRPKNPEGHALILRHGFDITDTRRNPELIGL